ncbi:mitochondrial ATP-independent inner membrane protease subunit 1a [Typha angustifolia]|uniref:mitochondrial ATP-independent inner membrane protease subunit 1a n=1 Tax=Typha angustifolia TaxID=59011 RepID=UPI003C3086B7
MSLGSRVAASLGAAARRFRDLPWRDITSDSFSRVFLVAKTLCAVHVINSHLCGVAFVLGPSMLPTMNLTGDVVAVDRVTARWGTVSVGDVVLLLSPENPRKTVAKRVMGLEGDAVTYFVDPAEGQESKTVVVPRGHVWVQGDNIYASRDSRQFGSVPYGLIQGRIFCRIWPPESFGFIGQKA